MADDKNHPYVRERKAGGHVDGPAFSAATNEECDRILAAAAKAVRDALAAEAQRQGGRPLMLLAYLLTAVRCQIEGNLACKDCQAKLIGFGLNLQVEMDAPINAVTGEALGAPPGVKPH